MAMFNSYVKLPEGTGYIISGLYPYMFVDSSNYPKKNMVHPTKQKWWS